MTIDEAISHCLEVAGEQEQLGREGTWYEGEDWNEKARAMCRECAADHRQLAKWLQELKQWRENPFKMIKDICANQFDCCNCPIGGYCRADDWFGYPSEWEVE